MKKAFAGVAKLGMVKRCACHQPPQMKPFQKQRTPFLLRHRNEQSFSVRINFQESNRLGRSEVGAWLKHAVLVAGLGGDNLQNVPVFNDVSGFIEAEDIDAGPVLVCIGGPNLISE